MILPDKEFLRVEEVAARWRNASGMPVREVDIFEYMKQGALPAYIFYKKRFHFVPSSELSSFDEYIKDRSSSFIRFRECSFVPPVSNLFDDNLSAEDVVVSDQDVYVKQKDLIEYEESAVGNGPISIQNEEKTKNILEKPLGAREREKLHLIIAALVELAELNDEKDYTVAKDIVCKVDLSENTVVKHLRAARDTQLKKKGTNQRY